MISFLLRGHGSKWMGWCHGEWLQIRTWKLRFKASAYTSGQEYGRRFCFIDILLFKACTTWCLHMRWRTILLHIIKLMICIKFGSSSIHIHTIPHGDFHKPSYPTCHPCLKLSIQSIHILYVMFFHKRPCLIEIFHETNPPAIEDSRDTEPPHMVRVTSIVALWLSSHSHWKWPVYRWFSY